MIPASNDVRRAFSKGAVFLAAAAVALALLPAAGAQQGQSAALPQQTQIINFSLLEALTAIGEPELAGFFGYVPEAASAPAFADYLLRRRPALKRFVKRVEKDLKETGAVNEWDRHVCLYLLMITQSPAAGDDGLTGSWAQRVGALALAQGLPLDHIQLRRKG